MNVAPNGWTGGQYSLARAALGGMLAVDSTLALMRARDGGLLGPVLLGVAAAAALALAVGWRDKTAAVLVVAARAGALLPARDLLPPLGLADLICGILLLFHLATPPAPYGSFAARGRADPGGGWRLPAPLVHRLWLLVALCATLLGIRGLLQEGAGAGSLALAAALLGYAALAPFARARGWLWLLSCTGCVLLAFGGDLRAAGTVLVLHAFLFDPAWIPPVRRPGSDRVFYDGDCGLCHRTVRFLLAEDRGGDALRYAPLGSDAFVRTVAPADRATVPDSIVLAASDGRLLVRSAAVLAALERLGGAWRLLARAAGAVPRPLRDLAYDGVARVRKRLFAPPAAACPLVPPELGRRFDA